MLSLEIMSSTLFAWKLGDDKTLESTSVRVSLPIASHTDVIQYLTFLRDACVALVQTVQLS